MILRVMCNHCDAYILDVDTDTIQYPLNSEAFSVPRGTVGFGSWQLVSGPVTLDTICPACWMFPFVYDGDAGKISNMLKIAAAYQEHRGKWLPIYEDVFQMIANREQANVEESNVENEGKSDEGKVELADKAAHRGQRGRRRR